MEFKKIIENKEYNFLRTDEHLGNRIMLLALGGSHAYGTSNANSDVDVRGIALEKPSDLIGLTEFKHTVDVNTDTTIYGFNRMIELLMSCNPNVIEILGCKPEHYLYVSNEGQQLLDNKGIFLSQKALGSFAGYANAQLNRLNAKKGRGSMEQLEREQQILRSVENAIRGFNDRYSYFDETNMKLLIDKSDSEELENEIFVKLNIEHMALRELIGKINELQNVLRQYEKINHRNRKRDAISIAKHKMNLLRLFMMANDLAERAEIVTYRENDLEILVNTRNDKYSEEEFNEVYRGLLKRFEYAKKNTVLPKEPNYKAIEELMMDINTKIIKGEI